MPTKAKSKNVVPIADKPAQPDQPAEVKEPELKPEDISALPFADFDNANALRREWTTSEAWMKLNPALMTNVQYLNYRLKLIDLLSGKKPADETPDDAPDDLRVNVRLEET